MRVTQPGQARAYFLDRNPLAIRQTYNVAGVAPHAFTVRWTYTVPANRKAYYHSAVSSMIRATAAAPVGLSAAHQRVNSTVYVLVNASVNNVVGPSSIVNGAPGSVLFAAETLDAGTLDLSTGGTIDYNVTAHLTEFDA